MCRRLFSQRHDSHSAARAGRITISKKGETLGETPFAEWRRERRVYRLRRCESCIELEEMLLS
jgi:hypothetical protein